MSDLVIGFIGLAACVAIAIMSYYRIRNEQALDWLDEQNRRRMGK